MTEAEKQDILATLKRGIVASPVLSAFGIQVRVQRGRFYIERQQQDEDSEPDTEVWGRITPLADADNELLLETANRKGKWSEVTQGAADNLIKAIASDTRGKFHGLGFLDASLRKLGKGQDRLPVKHQGKGKYAYADTGKGCTVQETLFHYFGIPIEVVAEPSNWYEYRRTPEIIEASKDRTRVLVQFTAETMSGETFGGTCLYIQREGQWAAYTIKPSDSENIAQAEAWLVKRKWRAW
ncbi:MAG: hypothetical protein WCJ35_28580 [Planctomycetota bacterium]